MFDLTTSTGVQSYLENTPFAASGVVVLVRGYGNFTYRITLRKPYITGHDVQPIKTLVMKHAKSYVASWTHTVIPFTVERQDFECLAFELIPELVGPSEIVVLPTIFHRDRPNGVMLMTDNGLESRTLKDALQKGPLSDDISRNIGAALGVFIGRIHAKTRNPDPGTFAYKAKAAFSTNDQGRQIIAAYVFGRIVPTLTEGSALLPSPPELSPETLSKLDTFSQEAQERVKTSNDVLNMGDFWTGNVLLVLEPTPRVMVVDWEAARPSFMGMDLGQFLAELHLLRVFHPTSRSCVDIIIAAFLSAYRAIILEDSNDPDIKQRLVEVAHDAAARVGAHIITIPSQVPWGGPELTREVAQEGVEYILRSVDNDEDWLRGSIVGGLWG